MSVGYTITANGKQRELENKRGSVFGSHTEMTDGCYLLRTNFQGWEGR